MSIPLTRHTRDTSPQRATANLYDERDLQAKAISRWEKQQHLWAIVQENIHRRCVKNGGKPRGACMTMSKGVYHTRLREEELGVVTNAAVPDVFSGIHTWESTLRTTAKEGAVRYLKLGRTTFPYALYCKVTDERRRDAERMINTRIMFPNLSTEKEANESRMTRQEYIETMPLSLRFGDYYKERLQKCLPQVERNMSHFMVPRAYLEVCGRPAPWTTKTEDAKAARKPMPAVVCIPPPPPQQQQQQQSRTNGPSTSSCDILTQDDDVGSSTHTAVGVGADTEADRGPCLEISTTRILFITRPGELAHGAVTVKNTGRTTVYYSWAPVQPRTALDGNDDDDGDGDGGGHHHHEKNGSNLGEGQGGQVDESVRVGDGSRREGELLGCSQSPFLCTNGDSHQTGESPNFQADQVVRRKGVSLRSLAVKSAQSKSFFCLSAETDGVILPDDEATFPFAVRASFVGRFMMHYELLMLPVVSPQVILELCAIVCDIGPSLKKMSQPVADALEAKAVTDVQRGVINKLVANKNMYEAVEIAKATDACTAAATAVKEAQELLIAKWRKSWLESSYTMLRIPFNRAVYERVDALHRNLAQSMSALGQPLHHQEWDGSVQTLRGRICWLRDAPTRNTLREALDILLRAARVSERESEPLDLLLQRVAGMTAFSTLVQRMRALEDSVAMALGLRVSRASTVPESTPNTRAGSIYTAGGGGAGRKVAGGSGASGAAGKSYGKPAGKARNTAVSLDATFRQTGAADDLLTRDLLPVAEALTDPSVRQEYDTRFFMGMQRLVGDIVDRLCATWDSSRCTIEAACHLPLLDITASTRRSDVHVIQSADDMNVDVAVEVVPPKKKK